MTMQTTTTTPTGSGEDLTNLDFLRAFALLLVMASHGIRASTNAGTWPRWNDYGFSVYFSFFLSALMLMGSLERRSNVLGYYIRRIWRIYPLPVVLFTLTFALHLPFAPWTPQMEPYGYVYLPAGLLQFVEHLLLIQNFTSGGSFLIYSAWPLAMAVQMWAALPMLFAYVDRNRKVWQLVVLWVVGMMLVHKMNSYNNWDTVLMLLYALCGAMAYVGLKQREARLPGWLFVLLVLPVTLVASRVNSPTYPQVFFLLLGLALPFFHQLRRSLFTKVCWYISRHSYAAYLLHVPGIVIAFHFFPKASRWIQFPLYALSVAVMSVMLRALIEAPCMKLGERLASKWAPETVEVTQHA